MRSFYRCCNTQCGRFTQSCDAVEVPLVKGVNEIAVRGFYRVLWGGTVVALGHVWGSDNPPRFDITNERGQSQSQRAEFPHGRVMAREFGEDGYINYWHAPGEG